MRRLVRIAAWGTLLSIAIVTLVPIGLRPHVPGSDGPLEISLEYLVSYGTLGILFAYGYPRNTFRILVLTVGGAALLEVLQVLDPTRHGRVTDFAAKALCGLAGVAIVLVARKLKHIFGERLGWG